MDNVGEFSSFVVKSTFVENKLTPTRALQMQMLRLFGCGKLQNPKDKISEHDKSGIYQVNWNDCNIK